MVHQRGKLVFLGLALWPALCLGEEARTIAVMPVEGKAAPAVVAEVSSALAAAASGAGRTVVRPAVPLADVRLTVECPEATPACTAVVGRSLGVQELAHVRVEPRGNRLRVRVTLFDVSRGQVARSVDQEVGGVPSKTELTRLAEAVFAAPAATPTAPRRRLRVRLHTWLTLGTGAAVLFAGAVVGALTLAAQSDLDSRVDPGGDPLATREFVDLADRGSTYATTANILLGAGAGVLAVGGVLLYLDWRHVEVRPAAGPHGATLTLTRRF